ncbi:hypothetical protein FACS189472_08650 [Alphaproteobacteria bacterium]|nr:hypothetical protein FACS189472_08650 [Alphaproteobacteria bacterium]
MVGIFNKIGKFFGKVKDVVKDTVLPTIGKIGDFMDSDAVQGIASFAAPALNTIVPGLGTGLGMALPFLSKLGKKAKGISKEWNNNSNYLMDKVKEFSGASPKGDTSPWLAKANATAYESNEPDEPSIPQGIQFARRPDALHSRIKLKQLPAAEDEYVGPRGESYVEEIDEVE